MMQRKGMKILEAFHADLCELENGAKVLAMMSQDDDNKPMIVLELTYEQLAEIKGANNECMILRTTIPMETFEINCDLIYLAVNAFEEEMKQISERITVEWA